MCNITPRNEVTIVRTYTLLGGLLQLQWIQVCRCESHRLNFTTALMTFAAFPLAHSLSATLLSSHFPSQTHDFCHKGRVRIRGEFSSLHAGPLAFRRPWMRELINDPSPATSGQPSQASARSARQQSHPFHKLRIQTRHSDARCPFLLLTSALLLSTFDQVPNRPVSRQPEVWRKLEIGSYCKRVRPAHATIA